jgi:hypothetical protein
MKNILKTMALALSVSASMSVATSALANDNNFYGGIALAKMSFNDSDAGISFDYDENNFKILGGMKIDNNFAVEAQFANFKKGEIANVGGISANAKGRSIGVAGLYYFNEGNKDNFSPFVKLGLHNYDIEMTTSVGVSDDNDSTKVFGGVGMDIAYDSFTLRTEYERYKLKDINDMSSFGIGAIFKF